MYDKTDRIVFDPTGGGSYGGGEVQNGGHKWFPSYENVKEILDRTLFNNINFLCYHTEDGQLVKKYIDFSLSYVIRVLEEIETDKLVYSIVVDCYKDVKT